MKTLSLAYDRYNSLIFRHAQSEDSANGVSRVEVSVENSSEDYPQMSTDESYTLSIPATGSSSAEIAPVIKITAVTVYGALRALESLSQLVVYDFDSQSYLVTAAPVMISDEPRYPHRFVTLSLCSVFDCIEFIVTSFTSYII